MFGFIFAAFCMFGLFALLRPRHHFHHRPHCRGRGRFDEPRRRGNRNPARARAERLKRKLRVDEDQEDYVDLALKDLHVALGDAKDALSRSRADLAAAFSGDEVDEAAIASAFAAQDEDLGTFRKELVSALKQIHSVLDPDQRDIAARWLSKPGGAA